MNDYEIIEWLKKKYGEVDEGEVREMLLMARQDERMKIQSEMKEIRKELNMFRPLPKGMRA